MTKIEMLDKLALIREAVAALPEDVKPLAVSVSATSEYIHISDGVDGMSATNVTERDNGRGPYKEYSAEVLGVPVIWLDLK